MSSQNEIVLYQPDEQVKLEVRTDGDTVWLNLNQMSILFDRDKSVISRHIAAIYKEGELDKISTVAKNATVRNESGHKWKMSPDSTVKEYLTVQNEGGRTIKRTQSHCY